MRILLLLALLPFLGACTDEPAKKSSAASVDQARICAEGGGSLSAQTNECACPEAQRWNGSRCETGTGTAAPPTVASASAGAAAASAAAASAAHAALTAHDKAPLDPELADAAHAADDPHGNAHQAATRGTKQDLRTACKAAGAHFDGKDSYCHCPGGDVLVSGVCRSLAGQANELVCTGVQRPGHWFKGRCDCEAGKDFIPGRGGCVARRRLTATTQRRICETSLNRGKWDARAVRCDCGEGRVWSGQLCQVQENIPSREVCESSFNHGRWDKSRKRCDCPAGRVWIDQSCRLAGNVDALLACASEANGGRWLAGESRCDCPVVSGRRTSWDAALKVCR